MITGIRGLQFIVRKYICVEISNRFIDNIYGCVGESKRDRQRIWIHMEFHTLFSGHYLFLYISTRVYVCWGLFNYFTGYTTLVKNYHISMVVRYGFPSAKRCIDYIENIRLFLLTLYFGPCYLKHIIILHNWYCRVIWYYSIVTLDSDRVISKYFILEI